MHRGDAEDTERAAGENTGGSFRDLRSA